MLQLSSVIVSKTVCGVSLFLRCFCCRTVFTVMPASCIQLLISLAVMYCVLVQHYKYWPLTNIHCRNCKFRHCCWIHITLQLSTNFGMEKNLILADFPTVFPKKKLKTVWKLECNCLRVWSRVRRYSAVPAMCYLLSLCMWLFAIFCATDVLKQLELGRTLDGAGLICAHCFSYVSLMQFFMLRQCRQNFLCNQCRCEFDGELLWIWFDVIAFSLIKYFDFGWNVLLCSVHFPRLWACLCTVSQSDGNAYLCGDDIFC